MQIRWIQRRHLKSSSFPRELPVQSQYHVRVGRWRAACRHTSSSDSRPGSCRPSSRTAVVKPGIRILRQDPKLFRVSGSQCCGSGMFIPDPDFYPSRIPDLGSRIQKQQEKRGVKKKFVVITFYVATNFTKLQIILVLKCWRKKCGPIFKDL